MKENRNLKTLIRNCDPADYRLIETELAKTNYDEIIDLDLLSGQYNIIDHRNNKYMGNLLQGNFDTLYDFAVNHFVHPDDAQAYKEIADRFTLKERLDNPKKKGVISGIFRLRGTDDEWIETYQLFISGKHLNLGEDTVRIYVYDLADNNDAKKVVGDQALREEVTGLLEGVNFYRPAQQYIDELPDPENWCIAVIHLVNHKLFSDWYGMDNGQFLLTQVAEELKKVAVECNGMPGYLGQEDFCLIMPYSETVISDMHETILDLISKVSRIKGFVPLIGIAMIDDTCFDIREYINRAALTADEIKDDLHSFIKIYDSKFHQQISEEYHLLNEFEDALDNGMIDFWLQPQCRVPDYKIVGAEALARWHRKDGDFVSPTVFVPILEKYHLVSKLDVFIWDSVCRWLRNWIDAGKTPVPISINVSRIDIFAVDVPQYLYDLIRKYNLDIDNLKVEITESAYAEDSEAVGNTIRKLREFGFLVLMDDFGSGYSSLNMLRGVSVDVIKLDAQFLKIGKQEEHKGISILESILNMTRSLATPIIVEGVETKSQLDFLEDLGCSYMQGFYFHKPMPLEEFEKIISDEENIDIHGFMFKANQQMHIREFMDENIFSDTMLNNIIGPVVFYNWKDKDVDIIRYNQQFFDLVGIELSDFRNRKVHIQDSLYPGDDKKLYRLLQEAVNNGVLGSKGVVRAYRPDGTIVSLALQIYFIGENEEGKQFYVSAHDVSELQYINTDFPGGYYRCTADENFEFLYISQAFMRMTGFDENEIQQRFDNMVINMVHPEDRERIIAWSNKARSKKESLFISYRLLTASGQYLYVAEQNQLSDNFGIPCWQSVIIDVTEAMYLRDQMNILSEYLADTVMFLHSENGGLKYEVAIHGLREALQMDAKTFEDSLNSGEFCRYIEGYDPAIPHNEYTQKFISGIVGGTKTMNVNLPNGSKIVLSARADRVTKTGSIDYIVILHLL